MISGELGEARVTLRANLDKFQEDLKQARAATERTARSMQQNFDQVEQRTARFGRVAAIMRSSLTLIGTAGAAAGLALLGMAKQVIALGDQIGKTSAKIGVTAEALQELRFAAERSGATERACP